MLDSFSDGHPLSFIYPWLLCEGCQCKPTLVFSIFAISGDCTSLHRSLLLEFVITKRNDRAITVEAVQDNAVDKTKHWIRISGVCVCVCSIPLIVAVAGSFGHRSFVSCSI
jgi:hypothetical protein